MEAEAFVNTLRNRLHAYTFSYNDEAELQDQLEQFFTIEGMNIEREYRLTGNDRPDFAYYLKGGRLILIEVKVDHSLAAHLRQIRRYATHPLTEAVVLLSPSGQGVPPELAGKPVHHIPIAFRAL